MRMAFALGAQATHRVTTVRLVWTNSWYDPAKEKKAAQSLVRPAPMYWARTLTAPRPAVRRVAGDPLGSAMTALVEVRAEVVADRRDLQLGPLLPGRVKAAMAGTWKSGFYYGSIKDGFTGLAAYGPGATAKTKSLIAAKQKQMESGSFNEFAGPVFNQAGKLAIPKGKQLTVNELYSVNWLVKGIIGSAKG